MMPQPHNTTILFPSFLTYFQPISPIFIYLIFPYFFKTFCLVFTFAVVLGHAGQNLPKSEIGQRPVGKTILSRLYDHLLSRRVGCKGYDVILGCYSPPIKCLFYFAWFLFVWLAIITLYEII